MPSPSWRKRIERNTIMNLAVLCDFDGTIAKIDAAEFILSRLANGDWRKFGRQFDRGKITLENCVRKEFLLVNASRKEILHELRDVIEFRPNFKMLAEYCRERNIPFVIVSAGLDFVIDYFLRLNHCRELVETCTAKAKCSVNGIKLKFPQLRDKTSVNFKQDLVRHNKKQGRSVIFIGDSSADFAAIIEADYAMAIKGSGLARICKNRDIAFQAIVDFQEVVEAISRYNFL